MSSYFLKSINFLDSTVTVGDFSSGEGDIDLEFSELPTACRHAGGIAGIELAENGAIISMCTVTCAVANDLSNAYNNIRIPVEGTVEYSGGPHGDEPVMRINAYDTTVAFDAFMR